MRSKIETDLLIGELIYKHLNGEISEDEWRILDSWVENEENTDFFHSLETTDRLYQGMIHAQYQDTETQFRKLQQKLGKKKRQQRLPWWIGTAAVLVIGVGLVWWKQKKNLPEQPFEFVQEVRVEDRTVLQTPRGNRVYLADTVKELVAEVIKKGNTTPLPQVVEKPLAVEYNTLATSSRGKIEIMLSDSSKVWLNAGSELRYPDIFGPSQRRVYLRGEAYFEVAKNAARPFIVNTGGSEIEVLGTQFNVKVVDESHNVTTLVEGCVKVRNQEDQVVLRPGQQAEEGWGKEIRVKEVDVRYDIAWKKNQFAFHEKSLFYILSELSGWYDFTFEIRDMQLANQIYTAIMPRRQKVDEIIQLLQRTGDFVYAVDENEHFIFYAK